MNLRSAPFLIPAALLGGCGLVYNYGDYKDQPTGGMPSSSTSTEGAGGGTSSSSTSSSTSGATSTSTSSSTTSSSSSSSSSSGACTGACVTIPQGWLGPVSLTLPTGTQPPCPNGASPVLSGGTGPITAGDCSQCTCEGPTGGTCSTNVGASAYGQVNCSGASTSVNLASGCQAFNLAAVEGPIINVADACKPGPPPTPGAASWTEGAAACAITPAVCPMGYCAGAGSPVCIYQASTSSAGCPGPFTQQSVIYTQIVDDRQCSACTCSTTGRTCNATVSLFSDANCGAGNLLASGNLDACTVATSTPTSLFYTPGTATGGTCTSTGGTLTGGVAPGTPYTVCCTN